jgi:predicted nucleotidyltransferase
MTQRPAAGGATARGKRARLLAAVRARRSGVTIYGLARALRRPYRRVFDAVKRLAAEGALRVEPVARNNRRATLVTAPPASGRATSALPAHLSEAERTALAALAARLAALDPRIESLRLFGSRARGASGPDSDLDLAVCVRGRRDAALERRIVAEFADVEWSAPLEGALRLSPLVRFAGEPRALIEAAIEREGIPVWKTPG